jgi:DMSO/TMAO reductase YedYZ molybdopterin-dependent catalytic subunit
VPGPVQPGMVRQDLDAGSDDEQEEEQVEEVLPPRYDAHPIEHMGHHLTMLAYDMNEEPLSFGHGAPLRLRNEIELGFKQVKWIKGH